MLRSVIACILAGVLPVASHAAILDATPSNLNAVFAAAQGGDTINLVGTFGTSSFQNRNFATRVTINAAKATFTDTVTIQNVTNLTVFGGIFGSKTQPMRAWRTVIIKDSNWVKMQSNTFLGNGATAGIDATQGILVTTSSNIQVSAGTFNNFKTGIGVMSSTNVKLDNSRFNAMTSDGINIVDSRFVTATANTCSAGTPYPDAHPDCIQLWSLAGKPVQSDITLLRNIARGATQGFTSFNSDDGGGLRIQMLGNTVATSYPQGIACYGCFNSLFSDNILSTLPGSLYQTSINIVGGANNIVTNNNVTAYKFTPSSDSAVLDLNEFGEADYLNDPIDPVLFGPVPPPRFAVSNRAMAFSGMTDEDVMLESFGADAGAVPEPATWAQLMLGLGLVGGFARRRARAIA